MFLVTYDLFSPESMTDQEIAAALEALTEESKRRKVAAADPDALVEWGFANLFNSAGKPLDPQEVAGVLVCPGARWGGPLSHKCTFATVDGTWVWDSPHKVADQMRTLPGPQAVLQSVTVLAPPPGTGVDSLSCRARNAVHELTSIRSFLLSPDGLEQVAPRSVRPSSHR